MDHAKLPCKQSETQKERCKRSEYPMVRPVLQEIIAEISSNARSIAHWFNSADRWAQAHWHQLREQNIFPFVASQKLGETDVAASHGPADRPNCDPITV
jgi:hypothetical protein